MTAPTVELAPRARQVLEGLSDGSNLATVALNLKIREGTARGYLELAKRKLHGASDNATALAIAYATNAIACPDLLDPEGLFLTPEQRNLVPLIGRGLSAGTMASELSGRWPSRAETAATCWPMSAPRTRRTPSGGHGSTRC